MLIVGQIVCKQKYENVATTSVDAGSVPVQQVRLSYASMNLVTSAPAMTGAPRVPDSGFWFFSFTMASVKDWMNCLWQYVLLDKVLAGCTEVEEGPALHQPARPLELKAEVDWQCLVDIKVLFMAGWRWDGGLGGELALIGDQRSIASLGVFGRGVRWIGALFEVSSLFHSFLSPASLPLPVFSLSFTTFHSSLLASCYVIYLSGSVPCNFSPYD